MPGLTGLTVAVKVTAWPDTEAFCEELTVKLEKAWLTVWPPVSVPLLALKSVSPA